MRIRRTRHADIARLASFFAASGRHSIFLHLSTEQQSFTDDQLSRYCASQDSGSTTLIATIGRGDNERVVGIASWFGLSDATAAEVAFLVDETRKLSGVGTALLEQLGATASRSGIRRFVAHVRPQHHVMGDVLEQSGFPLEKSAQEGMIRYTIRLESVPEMQTRRAEREHVARAAGARILMSPRTIAVVGAAREEAKAGGAVFRNLLKSGFTGTVYPVNRNAASIAGVRAYPTLGDIPEKLDLVVIAVPADFVTAVLDECAALGIPGAVVISAGFGEAGEAGRALEDQLREHTLSYGLRVVGPNCLGIANYDPSVRMNATFAPVTPGYGGVSMASQSGALGLALLDYAESTALGVRHFVSLGNRVDISSNDLLEFWEDDEATEVILLYLESFGNPRNFSRVARRVTRSKPIVAMKGGRSDAGARAASSHTGALAEPSHLTDMLFRRSGIVAVESIDEMFGVAEVLNYAGAPGGDRLAILTNSGGPGILAADAWARAGLPLARLTPATGAALRAALPAAAGVSNPVDMLAAASPGQYSDSLRLLLDDPNTDAVLVIYTPPLVTDPQSIADAVSDAVRSASSNKPVAACFMTWRERSPELRIDTKRRVPKFRVPEDAVRSLVLARQWARYRDEPEGEVPRAERYRDDPARERAAALVRTAGGTAWLGTETVLELLRLYGIQTPGTEVALTPTEAADAAKRLGFPVAIKLRSATVTHKSDVGGVRLGILDEQGARAAFEAIRMAMTDAGKLPDMDGVIVQKMSQPGEEMVAGVTMDPVFGHVMMAGFGGTRVEIMRDVTFAPHPLTDRDPERMLGTLKARALLGPWRGRAARDIAALSDVLMRLSALVEDFPELADLELNPLFVHETGKGCVAVDARARIQVQD